MKTKGDGWLWKSCFSALLSPSMAGQLVGPRGRAPGVTHAAVRGTKLSTLDVPCSPASPDHRDGNGKEMARETGILTQPH